MKTPLLHLVTNSPNTLVVSTNYLAQYFYPLFTVLVIVLLLLAYLVINLTKNPKKETKTTLNEAVEKHEVKQEDESKVYISKEKELMILNNLIAFEKSKAFLEKEMSLNFLAANIGINHRYLSYVINTYKNKDFTTYINELRINYIVNCIHSDQKYLQYKISYLAEKCGFASHSRFTITFKKTVGVSPSSYIERIKRVTARETPKSPYTEGKAVNY